MAFAEPDIVNGELRGGLGVVWRTPFARGHDLTQVDTAIPGLYGQKSACVKEMYSINHGELTAIDISLEEVERLIEQYGSGHSQFRATIFTDSAQALPRLRDGVNAVPAPGKDSFYIGHTLPVVRSCISRSYKLREKGCYIDLCWIPRRSTPGAKLADKLAGKWFEQPEVYWDHMYDADSRVKGAFRLRSEVGRALRAFFPGRFPWLDQLYPRSREMLRRAKEHPH
ncbi:hypothetical protein QBC37DRAFT_385058 [Rhypophila decipiens]|uniref:Uncharacterized protein n=1 Tax=Rhypophila decipiens TaxID=261697 RepID=A0AAN6YDQ6_9PEZI|nr:hypothetical protein QBC37DRAFT_385058 [Rhypophila decipiens]